MFKHKIMIAGVIAAALAGCTSEPLGPTVTVMPAPNKPLDVFAKEDDYCRNYAEQSVSRQTGKADRSAAAKAAVGTVIGAAVGGAVGGRDGAAVGAGGGLMMGSASGAGHSAMSEQQIQRRYDTSYLQCMYSMGNQIPGQYVRQPVSNMPPPPSSFSGNVAPPPPPSGNDVAPPPPPTE